MKLMRVVAATVIAAAAVLPVGAQQRPVTGTSGAAVNPTAAVLGEFTKRVDAYVDLKQQIAKGDAKLKETAEPAEIKKRQEALAARIAGLRADAKAGDILTVETRNAFSPAPVGCAELAGRDSSQAVELGEVLAGTKPGRTSADQVTLYKSMGNAMEDMVVANLVYETALSVGAGMELPR